jgi:hypothetical protein
MAVSPASRSRSLVERLFGAPVRRTGSRARRTFQPALDRLEQRMALAVDTLSIGGEQVAGFTDASGDFVVVSITGSAGTAVFRDGTGGVVGDGDDIASITITGASSDFQLTVGARSGLVPSAIGPLNGVDSVYLGRITADTVIRGINTVTSAAVEPNGVSSAAINGDISFVLESFVGVNFSKGGGLFVDVVTGGDGGGEGNVGILLSKGFSPYSTIAIREQLDAVVVLGAENRAKADGRLLIESATADSIIIVNQSGGTATNSKLEILGGAGPFDATVDIRGTFAGTVNLQSPAGGGWLFEGDVAKSAVLKAAGWEGAFFIDAPFGPGVTVGGDFAGTITSTALLLTDVSAADTIGNILLTVGGNVTSSARVNSAAGLQLLVQGSVLKGAQATAVGDLIASIEGNVSGATLTAGIDLLLQVGGNVLPTSAVPALRRPRNVANSKVAAGGDMVLFVSGDVSKSTFTTGNGDIMFELFLDVGPLVEFPSGILGSVRNSTFVSGGSIDGSVGEFVSGRNVSVSGSRFVTTGTGPDAELSLLVDGDFQGTIQGGSANVGLVVGGSVQRGSSLATGGDAEVVVVRNFSGVVDVNALQFFAGGNVAKESRIVAGRVAAWNRPEIARKIAVGPLNGGPIDGQSFYVGGRFDGILNAGAFDAYDGVATVTIIGGGAGKSARFYVGRFESDTVVFAGDFRGNVRVLEDLLADLTFTGNVDRITIGGQVLTDITVGGTLQYLNSNSYFYATDAVKKTGEFWSGFFVRTGSLTTGKYVTVVPVGPAVG